MHMKSTMNSASWCFACLTQNMNLNCYVVQQNPRAILWRTNTMMIIYFDWNCRGYNISLQGRWRHIEFIISSLCLFIFSDTVSHNCVYQIIGSYYVSYFRVCVSYIDNILRSCSFFWKLTCVKHGISCDEESNTLHLQLLTLRYDHCVSKGLLQIFLVSRGIVCFVSAG